MTYEKLKITSSSGLYRTIYCNGSYVLFGKKNWKFHVTIPVTLI